MTHLNTLIRQPEDQYFDRKSLWHGPTGRRLPRDRREVRDEIAEYVAAFANADGGTLVLGVEDDGTPTGHGYPADVVDVMLEVPRQRLKPPLSAGCRVHHGDHELLLFEVQATEQAVMVVGDGFPRRIGDTVVQESEESINALKRRGRVESVEADVAHGVRLDALDLARVKQLQDRAGLAGMDPADFLCLRQVATRRGSALVLYQAALLLFAKSAAEVDHPNAGVRIFKVEGTERLTGARNNVLELPRVEGGLLDVVERAYHLIGGLVQAPPKLHDLFFRESTRYPTFAWQEALVNALAHRDYRVRGRCVEVWLFDDRMEVISPGALLPEVDVTRLRRRERQHASRNPCISRVLAEFNIMRDRGEGIPRMFEEMETSLLRLPELRPDRHDFTVVLHNQPIFEAPDPAWEQHVRGLPVNTRQMRILVAHPTGSFTNAQYQSLNEVDRDGAYREIHDLVEKGILAPSGSAGRGARYNVVRPPSAVGAKVGRSPRESLAARMAANGEIVNEDYREAMGVSRATAKRDLAGMVASGALVAKGERGGRTYVRGPGWDVWVQAAQLSQEE